MDGIPKDINENLNNVSCYFKDKDRFKIQDILHSIWSSEFLLQNLTDLELLLFELTNHEELLEICENIVDYLWKNSITTEYHESVASFLMQCNDYMEDWKLERLAHRIVQSLQEVCIEKLLIFEAFANVAEKLEVSTEVSESIINRLCAVPWNIKNIPILLTSLSLANFSTLSKTKILKKSTSYFTLLDSETLAKCTCIFFNFNDTSLVGMIWCHMNILIEEMIEKKDTKLFANIIGPLLVQLNYTLRSNDAICTQVLRCIRNLPQISSLDVFSLLLMTSLCGESRNSHQITKHICTAINYAYCNNDRMVGSSVLRNVCSTANDPSDRINQIIKYCSSAKVTPGWTRNVLRGLIQLSFALLQFASPTSSCGFVGRPRFTGSTAYRSRRQGGVKEGNRQISIAPIGTLSKGRQNARICRLALNTLTTIFQTFSQFRCEILSTALRQMWSEPNKPICFQITELVAELSALCPLELTESAQRELEQLLDVLDTFPLDLATAVIHALLPLFTVSDGGDGQGDVKSMDCLISLQARIITVLRKMSTSYQIQVRRIAVAGFVTLLKNLKVKVSNFRSASQQSWSSQSSQATQSSCSQSWTSAGSAAYPLFTQINNTQVAEAAVLLPSDPIRNQALCTEIVGLLHRIISSTFFGASLSSPGGVDSPFLSDPEALVKSDIYWGLCEVVMYNQGLSAPVLTLLTRLLSACLDPVLAKKKPVFKEGVFCLPSDFHSVPFRLSQHISSTTSGTIESSAASLRFHEHPEVIVWCLQTILSLPAFRSHWACFALTFTATDPCISDGSASSQFTQSKSQLTQSAVYAACGFSVSKHLFARAASLLINLTSALRETPMDEFGLTPEMELGSSSPIGRLNRARITMLLGIYDSCLEFEIKYLLPSTLVQPRVSWPQLKRLFQRRDAVRKLLFDKKDVLRKQEKPNTSMANLDATTNQDGASSGISNAMINNVQNLCFIGQGEGKRLRSALLLSSLQSVTSGLHRALRQAPQASGFALHLLQTTQARLFEMLPSCSSSVTIASVYRDSFVQILAKILRLTMRYYATAIGEDKDAVGQQIEECTSSSVSLEAVRSAALSTISLCFSVAGEVLGRHRMHHLIILIHPVLVTPKPLGGVTALSTGSDDYLSSDEDAEDAVNDSSSSELQCTPSRALTVIVKLLKSWVTSILAASVTQSTHAVDETQTQGVGKSNCSTGSFSDLAILLPLLIHLCETRASLNIDVASSVGAAADFIGLDRVLHWLIRLLQLPPGSSSLVVPRLALQLARLLGVSGGTVSRRSTDGSSFTWDDLVILFSADVRLVLGDVGEVTGSAKYTPLPHNAQFGVVTKSSSTSFLHLLFSSLNQSLEDTDWLVGHLEQEVSQTVALLGVTSSKTTGAFSLLPDAMRGREEAVCSQLLTLGEALDEILQINMPAPSSLAEEVIRIATRLFHLLGRIAKHYITLILRGLGSFPTVFERIVRLFGRQVSPHAYSFVYFVQLRDAEKVKPVVSLKPPMAKKAKLDSKAATKEKTKMAGACRVMISRSLKDSKLIPLLIFAVEQYENILSTLSKKSKVNLVSNVSVGLSRDFRINQVTALANLEADAESSLSSLDEGDDDDEDENISPSATETHS